MESWRYCGRNVTIYPGAKILHREAISVGAHVIIDDFVFIGRHESMEIGNYVHISSHTSIIGGGRCWISDFATISSGVRILSGTDDFLGTGLANSTIPAEFRKVTRGQVWLGAHSVMGANAVVLPGVRIGEGAAVGAGGVVIRDLEPWTVYAGAPARPIKPRPKEAVAAAEQQLFAKYGHPERSFRF